MKHNIGLIGFAGSGKDTAALGLMDRGWRRVAFADALKMKAIGMGWDGKKDERGRRLLCDLGMAMRAYDPYHWIDLAKLSQVSKPFVVTDVRFQNEADVIRAQGGIIVRVVRLGIESGQHESEAGQTQVRSDQSIINDDSIQHLHAQLLAIAEGNL